MEPIDCRSPSARLTLLLLACALILGVSLPASVRAASAPESAIRAWNGGINLYRGGAFATQRTWQWCTAAGVQIVRNIAEGGSDEARSRQARYYWYMRNHNRYDVPARGYDMRPNTKLSPAQLNDYFTPWHYAPIRMAWEGQWVSIQPVGIAPVPPAAPRPAADVPAIGWPMLLRRARPF